jgi:uncharacterized protein
MRLARLTVAWLALLLATLLAGVPAAAQTFPPFTGLVVDAANVLPQATRDDLTRKLQALQHDTNRQLVVATIPSLQGYPIEDYGYRLGRAWGVGLKGVDNGIILFIAPNEPAGHRGPRIEVGTGLEPVVTDALSSVIINDKMIPRLRGGDVPGAMEAGTDALIAQLRASPDEAKQRTAQAVQEFNAVHQRARTGGGIPLSLVFCLFVLGIVGLSWLRRAGSGRYHRGGNWPIVLWGLADVLGSGSRGGGGGWSGGGDSGGGSDGGWGGSDFSGGGGGGFSGGGASGDW